MTLSTADPQGDLTSENQVKSMSLITRVHLILHILLSHVVNEA